MPVELALTLAATEDERLLQAEALVRGFCGWHIAPSRTETVTVRAAGAASLLLPSMHVTAIASVTDAGTALAVEDDYIWSAPGVLTRGSGGHVASWGFGAVTVVLTHGYVDPPAEVTAVVQAIAQRAVTNAGSLKSKSVGPFSEAYWGESALGLLESEKDTLRRYRIPAVG